MLVMLGTTLTTSFFDCLNPSAIAQQVLLQSLVRDRRQTWFFIAGIGIANFVLGLAIYLGVASVVTSVAAGVFAAYPEAVRIGTLAVGVAVLAVGLVLARRAHASSDSTEDGPEAPTSITPAALFVMGAAFCGVEITSALPYFGFLTVLAAQHFALPVALAFMLLYDLVYVAPLMLVYFGYARLQATGRMERLESALAGVAAYVVPVALCVVGGAAAAFGAGALL